MPEFKLNGKTYSGSTNYASAITYTEDDGSKTTVQDKISELNSNFDEQNKNLSKSTKDWSEAYANAKVKIDVCIEFSYTNKCLSMNMTIPVSTMKIGNHYISGYYFSVSSYGTAEVIINSPTELSKGIYINGLGQTITNTTFIYC